MGVSGTKGHRAAVREPRLGGWEPKADLPALDLEAVSWEGYPVCQKDVQRNRQFLANFAIHLVQQFRFEEAQLMKTKSLLWVSRRQGNHHLALQLRNLMTAVDQGMDVTSGIHAFLEAWRSHQGQVPRWSAARTEQGH